MCPSLYIQLVPPTDWDMTSTLGHLSGSKEHIHTQKATKAKRVSSREDDCGQRWKAILLTVVFMHWSNEARVLADIFTITMRS